MICSPTRKLNQDVNLLCLQSLQVPVYLISKPAWALQKLYVASSEQVITITQDFIVNRLPFSSHDKATQPTVVVKN